MISWFHNVESEVRLGTRPELQFRYKTSTVEMHVQVDHSALQLQADLLPQQLE